MEHKEREAAWFNYARTLPAMFDSEYVRIRRGFDAGYQAGSEGRWAAVSERLPDENTEVLASMDYGVGQSVDKMFLHHAIWRFAETGERHNDRTIVVAWMPLPEPFNQEDK